MNKCKKKIMIVLPIILILSCVIIYKSWMKHKLLYSVKPVSDQYINIKYNLNHINAEKNLNREKKLWICNINGRSKYVKDIYYESKLIKYKYKSIEKKEIFYADKNYKGAIIRYEVSFRENSTNMDKNLKNTIRVDIIDIHCIFDSKKSQWKIKNVKLTGSKNVQKI